MKKILIGKSETTAAVVEKIIAEPESDIVLVVPKGATLKASVSNFHLLRREAKAASKNLFIESVDEETLALAHAAQLEAAHPLFRNEPSRSLSDIVPRVRQEEETAPQRAAKSGKSEKKPNSEVQSNVQRSETVPREDQIIVTLPVREVGRLQRLFPKRRWSRILLVVLFVAGGIAWLLGTVLSKATVVIRFEEIPWQYQGEFQASKIVRRADVEQNLLPAQVFTDRKNLTKLFPASGQANVSQKAKGKLLVYNAYSSTPQTLVATTRFVTPDGKVFRLDEQIVVPGAKVQDGKIVPVSIETTVTADKGGTEYNVPAVTRLSIPGLKGSPKYEGFYGALPEGTAGGFVGERAVPTEGDITLAEGKMREILETSVRSNVLSGRPEGFVVLDQASEVRVTKLTVNKSTDSSGNFSIFGEAQLKAVSFNESDLRGVLLLRAAKDDDTLEFKNPVLEYSNIKVDYDRGELSFTVSLNTKLTPVFSESAFREKIVGKNLGAARSLIANLPHLNNANVSVWPMWRNRLPSRPSRIQITVN